MSWLLLIIICALNLDRNYVGRPSILLISSRTSMKRSSPYQGRTSYGRRRRQSGVRASGGDGADRRRYNYNDELSSAYVPGTRFWSVFIEPLFVAVLRRPTNVFFYIICRRGYRWWDGWARAHPKCFRQIIIILNISIRCCFRIFIMSRARIYM